MNNFLDFSKLSLKEHFDIIKNSTEYNPPFNSKLIYKHGNCISYNLNNYDIRVFNNSNSYDINIQEKVLNEIRYSLVETKTYNSYDSEEYSYRKDLYQDEMTYKEFILNDIRYSKNTFGSNEVRYGSYSDILRYNRNTSNYMVCTRSLHSDMDSVLTGIESNFISKNFQIIEKSKCGSDFVFYSEFNLHIPKEKHNNYTTYVNIKLIKETKDHPTKFEMNWNYDDRLIFNLDTPDASIMHLYNSLYTFQIELSLSSTEYYHFKKSLDCLEKILQYYNSELPIVSIILENIKRNKDGDEF